MVHLLGSTYDNHILLYQAMKVLLDKGVKIGKISYINTGDNTIPEDLSRFYKDQEIDFSIARKPIGYVKSESDYFTIENTIFQWYLDQKEKDYDTYVFVGGGHTFFALALQKAAFLFGAKDVFHMLYNGNRGTEPTSIKEVDAAILKKRILYVSMGSERGWPALQNLKLSGDNIRQRIHAISTAIQSRAIDTINEYPFECINLLPQKAIDWLLSPLEDNDEEWIMSLPKVELHCHLGGFATHGDYLEQVREAANKPILSKKEIPYPDKWPKPVTTVNLLKYMQLGDNNGSYLLRDKGCLSKQIELLYKHLLSQNIRYAEIRCSPFNYEGVQMSGPEVLKEIQTKFDSLMQDAKKSKKRWCHVNLIIIATRKPNEDKTSILKHIAMATKSAEESVVKGQCKVVGVDLAGFEDKTTRAAYFEQDFEPIHRAGIALTVHAGENDDSEGIWQAVFKLNTRRIGHGLNLIQSKELMRSVANRKIGVEMCPYANYQIAGFAPMHNKKGYPLMKYLDKGIQVSINTDNIGISNASLSDNFIFLSTLCPGITRMQALRLIRNGLEQAFIDNDLRMNLIKIFNEDIFNIIFHRSSPAP